jgi:hypothetical protein
MCVGCPMDRLVLHTSIRARFAMGRPFVPTHEAELLPSLLHHGVRMAGRGGQLLAIAEFVGPFGVADLVLIKTTSRRRLRRSQLIVDPLLNEVDATIAAITGRRRARSTAEIVAGSGFGASVVQRRLRELQRVGVLRATLDGRWIRAAPIEPLGQVHAFEAKIDDWRRGLDQAATYALWADTATLVLDRFPSASDRLLAIAKQYGVGLALRNRVVLPAPIHKHSQARRLWTSEHAVANLDENYVGQPSEVA